MPETPVSNRPSHANLQPGLLGSQLRRGLMRLHGEVFTPPRPSYYVHFLFNPQEISTSYTTNADLVGAQYQSPAQLATINRFPGSVGLAFSLLFDRSYEVWETRGLNKVGVLEDVAAIERMLEMDKNGIILPNPIQFYFGGSSDGQNDGGFYFYGYVQNINVTYTKFTINMIPVRAVVSVTAQQIITTNASQVEVTDAGATGIDTGSVLGVAAPLVAIAPPIHGRIPAAQSGPVGRPYIFDPAGSPVPRPSIGAGGNPETTS